MSGALPNHFLLPPAGLSGEFDCRPVVLADLAVDDDDTGGVGRSVTMSNCTPRPVVPTSLTVCPATSMNRGAWSSPVSDGAREQFSLDLAEESLVRLVLTRSDQEPLLAVDFGDTLQRGRECAVDRDDPALVDTVVDHRARRRTGRTNGEVLAQEVGDQEAAVLAGGIGRRDRHVDERLHRPVLGDDGVAVDRVERAVVGDVHLEGVAGQVDRHRDDSLGVGLLEGDRACGAVQREADRADVEGVVAPIASAKVLGTRSPRVYIGRP